MLSNILGSKKCYISSLLAMVFGMLWSMVFFYLSDFLVEVIVSVFMEFSTALHVLLKEAFGDTYVTNVRELLRFIAAIITLFIGMRFGFKGSKRRRVYYSEFTDGFADVKSSLVHHYKCYGAMDFISALIVSFWLHLSNNYVANFCSLLPSHYIAAYVAARHGALYLVLSVVLLSLASVYGVYSSQNRWCADLLYDLE